jgi:hypothetical protein
MDISDKLKNKWVCDYCDELMLIPDKYVDRLIGKSIKLYQEKNMKSSLIKMQQFAKMSSFVESYLEINNKNIYDRLDDSKYSLTTEYGSSIMVRDFLHYHPATYISTSIKCSCCFKESCDFHLYYGGFQFYKCKKCNNNISSCGWCQTNHMERYKSKYCIDCFMEIEEEKVILPIKINITTNNNNTENIINFDNKKQLAILQSKKNIIVLTQIMNLSNFSISQSSKVKYQTSLTNGLKDSELSVETSNLNNYSLLSEYCTICFCNLDNDYKKCIKCNLEGICSSCDTKICMKCKIKI